MLLLVTEGLHFLGPFFIMLVFAVFLASLIWHAAAEVIHARKEKKSHDRTRR